MYIENYEQEFNLTPLQKAFWEEYNRQGAAGIRKGKTARDLVSLALIPKNEKLNKESSFILHNKVQILSFSDQVRSHNRNNGNRNMQALCKLQGYGLNGNGTVTIGETCGPVVDFHLLPRQPYPLTLEETSGKIISWPQGGGNGLIRKTESGFSFYMGRLKVNRRNKKNSPPQLVFHIPAEYFEGDKPVARLAGDLSLPTEGQTDLGPVRGGETIVELTGEIKFAKTVRQGGKYRSVRSPGLALSTSDRTIFSVLNQMTKAHNDFVLSPDKVAEVVEPAAWLWMPMVEFDQCRLTKAILDKGFKPTSALVAEVLFQMSIEGTYDIRRISTKPVNIARCKTGEYIARYQDGQQQALPACAVVDVTSDTLGQYVPRKKYEWSEFSGLMGDLLLPFMRDFIIAQAIQPDLDSGWRGPGILLDAGFAQGLIRYANKDSQGKIKWYWDLRESLQYLQEDGAIVAPPIIYDCQDSQLNLGIMTVNLAFPKKKKDPPRLFKQDAGV